MFESLKLKKKAEAGDLESMKALAELYRDKGDWDSALFWSGKYKKTTRINGLSEYDLSGIMHFLDIGTMINDGILSKSEYIDLLEKKAEECNDAMSLMLFAFKFNGDENSFSNDRQRYFRWIKKAAELGEPNAQFLTGLLYNGDENSLYNDADKYVYWLTKSAEQGLAYAQFMLGGIYFLGKLVPQDMEKGIELLRKAAEQGEENAIECLNQLNNK